MKSILCKRTRLLGLLLLMLVLLFAAGCATMQVQAEEADSVMEQTLESEYFVGQNINIPSAELIVDGANIPAEASVIFPDGTVVRSNKITLNQVGRYTVKYEAKKDNKNYFNVKTFDVHRALYELSGNGEAVYGIEQRFDAEGLKVALAEDSVFKLNKKVNLADLENETPFIKLRINPEREGFAELYNIYIKVSDANDSNVFFALKISYLSTRLNASQSANVFGYINDLTTVYSGATVCVPQVAEWTGTPLKASFVGDTSIGELNEQFMAFYFNPIKQEVLGEDLTNNKYVVLSLSSFTNEWDGFTSDEVYIEIYGDNFRATKANLFIDSIGEVDLSVKEFLDFEAPKITVNYGDVNPNDCPKGYIGGSYPVFDAIAVDYNEGIKSVVKNVYYNYYSAAKVNVPILDGRFSPTRAGVYTIVYTASDSFGNLTEEYIDIEIENTSIAPEFVCDASNSYTTNCMVGESVELAEVVASGYTHSYIVTTTVIKDGKVVNFDTENQGFTILESGVYTIKYIVVDFVGRECEFVYTLTVEGNDKPIFLDEPENFITDNFIVGYQHKLPNIRAVFVNPDNTKVDVPVVISTNAGAIDNGYFTPTVAGEIIFTCVASYNGKTITKEVKRQAYSIKSESGIDYKSMFLMSDNVTSCYSETDYAEYMVTGNGKINFINTVLAENAFVKIQTDKSYREVSEVIFRLLNPYNLDNRLEVTFKSFDGSVFVSINGQEFKAVVGGDFSGDNPFEIKYVNSEKTVYVNGLSYSAGNTGLDADYALLEIEVVGKSANSVYGLIVEKVGNQSLSRKITIDNQKPIITSIGDFSGSYSIGTTFVSPLVLAKDIVCPELKSFKMTVCEPDGKPITINGVEINGIDVRQVEFKLTSYGSYVFEYQAIDQSNKKETISFVINVLDTVAPTVKISGSYNDSEKVGSAINIAQFIAEDNFDSSETLVMRVLVMDTNHNFKIIPTGKTFTPDKAGKYTVFCYVTDSFGNVGICSYNIVVK